MREILFRGKTTKKEQEIHAFHNVWVEGDLIKNRYKWHIHPKSNCFRSEKELAKCMIAHEVIPETVGQFTGLTDKNGKKIFEGDIVKTKFGRLCIVVWFSSPEHNGWDLIVYNRVDVIFTKAPDRFDLYDKCNLEVISNIYDNAELLGE